MGVHNKLRRACTDFVRDCETIVSMTLRSRQMAGAVLCSYIVVFGPNLRAGPCELGVSEEVWVGVCYILCAGLTKDCKTIVSLTLLSLPVLVLKTVQPTLANTFTWKIHLRLLRNTDASKKNMRNRKKGVRRGVS